MVVLKKLKSATLIETLVATVLIVLVFMISSLLMNTMYSSLQNNNTRVIDTKIKQLLYLAKHQTIQLPYSTNHKDWEIYVALSDKKGFIAVEAVKADNTITNEYYVGLK